ncbi:hypothetical protein ACB092_01G271200 [Castanea dentata]
MVYALLAFLLGCPEHSVPYPWERCYNVMTKVLYYKNIDDGTMVIDLRPWVNLGGDLHHENSIWNQLTGQSSGRQPPFCDHQYDHNSPVIFYTNCLGCLIYIIMPDLVQFCPLCGQFVS